jgi:hypothetical protein
MSEEITIRYRWTIEEVQEGSKWHFRHRVRWPFRFLLYTLMVLFFLTGAWEIWKKGPSFNGFLLLGVGLYVVVMLWVVRPWLVGRRFARRPGRNSDVQWIIGAKNLHMQFALGSSEISWQAFVKVVQTPTGFLLYPLPQIFHWLPRRGFTTPEDFDRFSQLAQSNASCFRRVR